MNFFYKKLIKNLKLQINNLNNFNIKYNKNK